MATDELLDLKRLIKPIARKKPAGTDLRGDQSPQSSYYAIKDERAKARSIERRIDHGEDVRESPRPNWRTILKLAPEVIAKESKDLEITAYLIEALVREKGFVGLAEGFRLVRGLVESCWDALYPLPDEEGIASRVAHLAGLNGEGADGTLIRPILGIPLTAETSVGTFSYADYQQAQQLESLDIATREQRVSDGAISMEQFQQAVAETPRNFFVELRQEIAISLEEYLRMGIALDEQCGADAPHATNIRRALELCADTVQYIAGNLEDRGPIDSDEEMEANEAIDDPLHEGGAVPSGSKIRSRQQAFAALKSVAEYFRRTEPHSPLSYGAEQLVRWGQTSLPELLSELVPDRSSREHLFTLTGIQPPEGN